MVAMAGNEPFYDVIAGDDAITEYESVNEVITGDESVDDVIAGDDAIKRVGSVDIVITEDEPVDVVSAAFVVTVLPSVSKSTKT